MITNVVRKFKDTGSGGLSLSDTDMEILNRHCINDLPRSCIDFWGVRVILLLESPYRDEVSLCHLHPLAGTSGENVTKIFAQHKVIDGELKDPIGCLVRARIIRWLAIMNVSQLPLQGKAYRRDARCSDQVRLLIKTFEQIKETLEKRECDVEKISPEKNLPQYRYVLNVIIEDFIRRISRIDTCARLYRHRPLVVPCGWVARNFLDKAPVVNIEKYSDRVLHPEKWNTSEINSPEILAKKIKPMV